TLGIETPPFHWTAAALIAIAMGSQTSASRHLAVPDMVLPLATLAVHGLGHDSRLAGGRGGGAARRLGLVCRRVLGAAAGAGRRGGPVGLFRVAGTGARGGLAGARGDLCSAVRYGSGAPAARRLLKHHRLTAVSMLRPI